MNILVVEDEVRLARNIADALKSEKYTVTITYNGLQAEEALQNAALGVLPKGLILAK